MNIEPVTLEGRHVRLEPLSTAHLAALTAIGCDPDLWTFVPYRVATPEDMQAYIAKTLAAQAAGLDLPFVTFDRGSQQAAGSTRFLNIDRANRRVEIGATWLAAPYRRTALNTEAKYLMLRHAFETWGCIRVELKTDARNQRSRTAIRRIGATEEGTLRQHFVMWDGHLRDSVYYSILDKEWPRVKADLEARLAR